MMTLQTRPYALAREQAQILPADRALVMVKAASEQTGQAFSLFEVKCPPGHATPLLIHYAEDVAIYVLEGTLTLFWGGDQFDAAAGAYSYQPRGIPHGFRVRGAAPARILYLSLPGGLDRFVLEQAVLAPRPEGIAAAARHQIEILGPLPD